MFGKSYCNASASGADIDNRDILLLKALCGFDSPQHDVLGFWTRNQNVRIDLELQ